MTEHTVQDTIDMLDWARDTSTTWPDNNSTVGSSPNRGILIVEGINKSGSPSVHVVCTNDYTAVDLVRALTHALLASTGILGKTREANQ